MKYILSLICVFGILNLNAQQKFSLGIKLGQNLSSVNNVVVDHNAASYHVGAVAEISIAPKFSIVPEVVLTQTKLENVDVAAIYGVTTFTPQTFHLSYLTIPVLAQFSPIKMLQLQAGPQYGILLDQSKDGSESAKIAFTSGEFSVVGGAKIDLGGFFLYGRYVIGMNNIGSAQELTNNLQDQSTWKTRQWQIGAGMTLFKL